MDSDTNPKLVYLALGSNLGDKLHNITQARDLLIESGIIISSRISSLYSTEPVGVSNQPWFVNTVISGLTSYSPENLLFLLKSTEYLLGRQSRQRWHEREIDIDILFYDNMIFKSKYLEIPHGNLHLRKFVLVPLAELSPELIHPIIKKSAHELLNECPDNSVVVKL